MFSVKCWILLHADLADCLGFSVQSSGLGWDNSQRSEVGGQRSGRRKGKMNSGVMDRLLAYSI